MLRLIPGTYVRTYLGRWYMVPTNDFAYTYVLIHSLLGLGNVFTSVYIFIQEKACYDYIYAREIICYVFNMS